MDLLCKNTVVFHFSILYRPLKYDVIANDLNIKVPNVRRILGQGIFSNDFERVSRGFYIVKTDVKTDVKNDNDIIEVINFRNNVNNIIN